MNNGDRTGEGLVALVRMLFGLVNLGIWLFAVGVWLVWSVILFVVSVLTFVDGSDAPFVIDSDPDLNPARSCGLK